MGEKKVCVKVGVSKLCVCVSKLCVKESEWQSCVSDKVVCDKVVCEQVLCEWQSCVVVCVRASCV